MGTRKERNAAFVAAIDNVSEKHFMVACKKRNYEIGGKSFEKAKDFIKNEFDKDEASWVVDDIASEYNDIKDYNDDNLEIWEDYLVNNNANRPIAKANGDFLNITFEGIRVNIDGISYTISDADFVSIDATEHCEDEHWANVSFAVMQKLIQIKQHMSEIKRLVE